MEKKKDRTREKGKSGGRGAGKKMFIANEDELELREREVQEERGQRNKRRGETETNNKDEEEEEENEEQEEGQDSVFTFEKQPKAEPTDGKKGNDEEEDSNNLLGRPDIRNPNHARKQGDPNDPTQGTNRKEREALAAAKAKEDYMRRHMAGETEQAQKELARLAIVRARREAAKQKREAEGRAPGWTAEGVESDESSDEDDKPAKPAAAPALSAAAAKKKAAAAGEDEVETAADGGPPKLKAMDIKKMSGDQLKESLKARNLDIQGQKKDLIKRLCDYEAARP